jgi:hypothetical protein
MVRARIQAGSVLIAVSITSGGCAFLADPIASDLGVRRSPNALQVLAALCPGETVAEVKVTDYTDAHPGAVLWDSDSRATPIDLGTAGPIQLNHAADRIESSKSVLIELGVSRRDGRVKTQSIVFAVKEMPTTESNRWLSCSQELVDEKDLLARGCSDS